MNTARHPAPSAGFTILGKKLSQDQIKRLFDQAITVATPADLMDSAQMFDGELHVYVEHEGKKLRICKGKGELKATIRFVSKQLLKKVCTPSVNTIEHPEAPVYLERRPQRSAQGFHGM